MAFYIGDKYYDLSDNELRRLYINDGCEGNVYHFMDWALKIYNDSSYRRLSLENARLLCDFSCLYFLLPRELVYDENKKYNGYCTKYMPYKSPFLMHYLTMEEFRKMFDAADKELKELAKKKVLVSDLSFSNFIYNNGLFFVDPGGYTFALDKSFDEIYKENHKALSLFMIFNFIKVLSQKSPRRDEFTKMFWTDGSIVPILDEAKPEETMKQFIKRITS